MGITPFPNGVSSFGSVLTSPLWPGLPTRVGRHFFVDAVNGNNGRNGRSPDRAFATVQAGVNAATDGNGDTIWVFPGSYAETLDITKRDLAIIGASGRHPGRTQIIGDGTTARATIRVDTGFARGFVLANLEVDTNGVARPAVHIVSDNTGALNATYGDAWWWLHNVRVNSGNDTLPSAALYLDAAIAGYVTDCMWANCTIGIAISAGLNLEPDNVQFWNNRFWDNVTADIATVQKATTAFTAGAVLSMTNMHWFRPMFMDRGGTPVTNYANIAGGTHVNCGFYDFYAARDVADATLMQLPVDFIALGHSAGGVESIIGA